MLVTDSRILRIKCDEIQLDEKNFYIRMLVDVYNSLSGVVGLSAPQIGVHKKLFLIKTMSGPKIFINPRIIWKFGKQDVLEGCMSVEYKYWVKRPMLIFIEYQDENLKKRKGLFLFNKASVVVHEINHLNGVLISDIGVKSVKNKHFKYGGIYEKE